MIFGGKIIMIFTIFQICSYWFGIHIIAGHVLLNNKENLNNKIDQNKMLKCIFFKH